MKAYNVPFTTLLGKTITLISGMKPHSGGIEFFCNDGTAYRSYHMQDCCESVYVAEVYGDVEDLIGTPILEAEEVCDAEPGDDRECDDECCEWTFYKLGTIKGFVTIRWYGESNGYYSMSVQLDRIV